MHCEEDTCGRTFRNGDIAYAVPIRLIIVRRGKPTYNVVERVVCAACWRDAGHVPLQRVDAVAND